MQLFYAPDLTTPLYTLGEEESKHCIRVLRLRRGDTLHLTDGRGTLYRCEIAEEDARRCTVRVVERFPRLRTDALPPDDGRGADQEYRTLRVVPRKGDRGGRGRDRPAPVRTFGAACAQNRTCRAGRRFGHEAVAQSLLSRAASTHPAGRPARRAVRRAAADRPLRRAPYGKMPSVRHAPPARKPAGAHRPRRRLLAR